MGTNFYWLSAQDAPCPHCGRSDDAKRLHIGKSSAGWVFALHAIPEEGINDLSDWRARFKEPGSAIFDEYGDRLDPKDMLERITKRKGVPFRERGGWAGYASEEEFHARNYSQRGPRGLLRAKIGPHCTAHGSGTWDLQLGEFS